MKRQAISAADEEPMEFMKEILAKDYEFFKASGGIDALLKEKETLPEIILSDMYTSDAD